MFKLLGLQMYWARQVRFFNTAQCVGLLKACVVKTSKTPLWPVDPLVPPLQSEEKIAAYWYLLPTSQYLAASSCKCCGLILVAGETLDITVDGKHLLFHSFLSESKNMLRMSGSWLRLVQLESAAHVLGLFPRDFFLASD